MWTAFANAFGVEEGQGSDTTHFIARVLEPHSEKVYPGSFFPLPINTSYYMLKDTLQADSPSALTRSKDTQDAKHSFPTPITVVHELFDVDPGRNYVHMELNIEGSSTNH